MFPFIKIRESSLSGPKMHKKYHPKEEVNVPTPKRLPLSLIVQFFTAIG